MIALVPGVPSLAGGGDISLDFTAAAPLTYDHAVGGGAYDDRTIGKDRDVVESLEGGDFACDDIVTFLTAVEVDEEPDDALQAVEIDYTFLADSTGQSGAALSNVTGVRVNYGVVQAGDGPDGTDQAIEDDGESTATLVAESLTGPLFEKGSELHATVEVTDLEAGEVVVLRVDVRLACDPGSRPTGNLQAGLTGARIAGTADPIPVGTQTIPFKEVGEVTFPGLDIEKATNGRDADEAPGPLVVVGSTVVWTYVVTNTGNVTLTGVAVTDDRLAAGEIDCGDGTNVIGSLPPGEENAVTCTASGIAVAGQYANSGTATAGELTDTDPSHYFGSVPDEPGVDIEKATNGQDADEAPGPSVVVGSTVAWTYVVTNTGNVTLTGVAVTDDRLAAGEIDCGDGTNVIGSLPPGEENAVTCTASGTATAGQYANVGRVTAVQEVSDTDTSHYYGSVPVPPIPDLGAIGDRVWVDADADGYQADFEPGYAGLTVALLNSSGLTIDTETTDAGGNYLFTGLGSGTYFVQFALPPSYVFSPADLGVNDGLDSDAAVGGRTAAITLGPGQIDLSWDAGIYRRIEVSPQVITPTATTTTAPEALPFTGGSDGTTAGIAVALAALGGLILLAARRREERTVVVAEGWYSRLRTYDLRYWDR